MFAILFIAYKQASLNLCLITCILFVIYKQFNLIMVALLIVEKL